MTDTPATVRTGGRYIRDPQTGDVIRADEALPPPAPVATEQSAPKAKKGA